MFFWFNSVSKTLPCKNVISRFKFVSYLKWPGALKPEIIFTSPEIGHTKQLDNWSSPVTPQERNLEILRTGIHLAHSCRSGRGPLVPSASREKLPLPGKTAALQQEAESQQPTKSGWNPSSTYTCQTWAKLHRGTEGQALHAGEIGHSNPRKTQHTSTRPLGFFKNQG